MMYSNRPYLLYLPKFKQTPMRRALALACFATLVSGCESDNDNGASTFTVIPNSAISEPSPLSFTTLATTFDVYGTVVADAPERLVDQISLTAFTTAIDASGNAVSDASGNLILSLPVFSPPLGNEAGGFYWQGSLQAPGLSIGSNLVNATTSFNGGQESNTQTLGAVVLGSSWMKESAIQYDASGNLYALDQLAPALLEIDKSTGAKTVAVNLATLIDQPVDLLINGTTAYVLDGGGTGIYSIANFASAPIVSAVTDCAASQQFIDAVAFDADFAAVGSENMFFVLDRGLKNIVFVQADNVCSIPSTPTQDVDNPGTQTAEDTIPVEGLLLDRPTDVVYHKPNNTLFVSGQWVNFGAVQATDASGNLVPELDASGNNLLDASGNAIYATETESFITSGNFVVGVPLDATADTADRYPRVPVEFVADASGNNISEIESAGALGLRGDDLFVFDSIPFGGTIGVSPGIVAADVTSFTADSPELFMRPVSGGLRQRDGTTSALLYQPNNNPSPAVPLSDAQSIAFYDDPVDGLTLTTLSMQLGSYIDVDLSDPTVSGCVEIATDPNDDEAVLQCEFSGARSLVAGGAAIKSSGTAEYSVSNRAGFSTAQLSNVVNSTFGFLSFNKPTGTPSLGFSSVLVDANDANRIDQLLLSDGLALAATSRSGGADYLAVDADLSKDRLMSFFVGTLNERAVVSELDAIAPFGDPLASFVRQPRIYDAVSDTVDASQPLSYYLVDRDRDDALVQVILQNVSDDIGDEFSEARGDRALLALTGTCNLNSATALVLARAVTSLTGPADYNRNGAIEPSGSGSVDVTGDGLVTTADDEGGNTFYESYASVFVAAGMDLVEIDLLDNSCQTLVAGAFPGASVTGMDIDLSETLNSDGDEIESRSLSVMAVDSSTNELIEIRCLEDVMGGAAPTCSNNTYPMLLNQPESAAAINVDWTSRNARVFDDKLNAVFLVDVAPRDAAGAPLSDPAAAGAIVTGQTVIEVRGLPLNCDPAMDAEGCLNL